MISGFDFPIEVIRTDRQRSVSIQVHRELVKIRVPKKLSDKGIQELVIKRIPWIKQKLQIQAQYPPPKPKQYVDGEAFPYLGRNYRLRCVSADFKKIKLRHGYLQVPVLGGRVGAGADTIIKAGLEDWYKTHALAKLTAKTQRYAAILRVEPRAVRVRGYKSRWGSCSRSGDISYNWRIIMAPTDVVDYVVVHELCHILEHNHSAKFWCHVEHVLPDYREYKTWLAMNASALDW